MVGKYCRLSSNAFLFKRFGIDVIGVTSNPECKLAKSSNIKIILPKVFEAGPHKLAAAYD